MSNLKNTNDKVRSLLSRAELPRVSLYTCSDPYRLELLLQTVLNNFAQGEKAKSPGEVDVIDVSSLKSDNLALFRERLLSLSLFAPQTYFVLKNIDQLHHATRKKLFEMLADHTEGNPVLLLAAKLPSKGTFEKNLEKSGALIALPELKGRELTKWVTQQLKGEKLKIEHPEVVDLLIEMSGGSPARIRAAIEQLSLYCEGCLSFQAFGELFPVESSYREFDLPDTLARGDLLRALSLTQKLLQSGSSPFALVGMLYRTFSHYVLINSLIKKGLSDDDIQSSAGIQPWIYKRVRANALRYSLPQIYRGLSALLRADCQLKDRSLGSESVFDVLVEKLTALKKAH